METVESKFEGPPVASNCCCEPPTPLNIQHIPNKTKSSFKKRAPVSKNSSEIVQLVKGKKQTKSSTQLRTALRNQNSRNTNKREDMLAQEFSNLSLYVKESKVTSTGIYYNERMKEHLCLWDPNYPERPERFTLPLERCQEYGLLSRCALINCQPASEDELLLLHSSEYIENIRKTKGCTDEEALEKISSEYDAIYFHPSTYELALLSAGSAINLATQVIQGKIKNGMAIIRPPGHHAMSNEACGYCFFNNVALAAKYAVEKLGLKRVLIVDWDVHHGQASQQMFYDDPRVLYFSIHRYEHGAFWPNLRESNFDYVGEGRGMGFNINVPLNKIGMGNAEYLAIFHQLLLPVAYEFAPELVIVSSGYDAALGCFEGCMEVTPSCYAHLMSLLMGLADGKICVVLEGGYCLKSLSEGVALTLKALLGDPCPFIGNISAPCKDLVGTIWDVIYAHRPFWKCFQFQGSYQEEEEENSSSELHRYRPKVQFVGSLDKPTKYETRNCYPVQTEEELRMLNQKLDSLIAETKLSVPENRTCFVYDDRMLLHRNINEVGHPETPDRIICIKGILEEFGILPKCQLIKSRMATEEELELAHTRDYIDLLKATPLAKPKDLSKLQKKFQSIYLCQDSYNSALLSAGSLFEVLDTVISGQASNGIAVIRPPGHHAEKDKAYGFCLFNNVALAAKLAVKKYHLSRVLIVDWDVHHGNGTQHMFEDDPRVLYISIHRYDNGTFFPCSEDANYNVVGKGPGAGFNINIPWNKGGMGDGDYIAAFTQIVLPVAYQFNPELVLVSAGFDAARGDPLGGCKVSPECYGHMTQMLSSLAYGKIILALEGGYNLASISQAMLFCSRVLLNYSCPPLSQGLHPCSSAVSSIMNVLLTHRKFWSCLQFQAELPCLTYSKKIVSSKNGMDADENGLDKDIERAILQMDQLTVESESNEQEKIGTAAGASSSSSTKPASNLLSDLGFQEDVTGPQTVYAIEPLSWCPHLEIVNALPSSGIDVKAPCMGCGDKRENWICLTCFGVYCGRYVNKDMLMHHDSTGHCIVMSFLDLSVWCYGCEAYVHNQILHPIKQAAHLQKFGENMPSIPPVEHQTSE